MSRAAAFGVVFGIILGIQATIIWSKGTQFKRNVWCYIFTFVANVVSQGLNSYALVADNNSLLLISTIMQLVMMYVIALLCTDGPVFFSIVLYVVLCRVNTLVIYIIASPFPGALYAFSVPDPDRMFSDPSDYVLGGVLFVLSAWLCAMVYRKIFPRNYRGGDRIWRIIYILYCCTLIPVYVYRSIEVKNSTWSIIIVTVTDLLIVLGMIAFSSSLKKRIYVVRKQEEKRRTLELLDRNYREAVEKNKELSKIKHDLNKELQVIKLLAENGQNTEARSGMLDLLAKHSEYAELSFSGDAKFDMFISLIFREADDRGIILEHIIEQSKENIEAIDRYTSVLKKVIDELMDRSSRQYRRKNRSEQDEHSKQQGQSKHQRQSGKNIDDTPWMRITCRRKGRHTLFNVEYSIPQSEINRRKIISLITITRANELKSEQMLDSSIVSDGGNYYVEEADGRGLLSIMFD